MKEIQLDARTKTLVVLVSGFFIFVVSDVGLIVLFLFLLGYSYIAGERKVLLGITAAFLFVLFFQRFAFGYGTSVIMATIAFFAYFAVRLIPVFMGGLILSKTPPGELIATLQKCYVPRVIIVPLAVGLRFLPTIRQETATILDVMRLRGIYPTVWNIWRHPLLTFEYLLVPLVIRSLTIADDISMAAVTRGVENPAPRSSLRAIKFGQADFWVLTGLVSLVIILLIVN
ncbi:energy-coupling factor transporter transmembrane component T [Carnobacterium gallinarum]|uniref:energy-coupling factor transporter transmembrane component T n=1 Tax=Carnobacterium gallinarum TaxID=2749 RepID=UPI0005524954|nr:energy-coupling factor transporter transmembrane component T [Carnobacterium gallinarum]